MNDLFRKVSQTVSAAAGTAKAFVSALLIVIVWALTGPVFHFSDTWQLVINTGTTIVTFLMVFLIQNTQNRDARAMHLKLDELIEVQKGASNSYVNLEDLSDAELNRLHDHFQKMHDRVEAHRQHRLIKKS
jgi:low affinity Fe/Cu permease